MPEEPYAKYIGEGAFVAGVPARDLTQEEWEAIPIERCKLALAAGTHVVAPDREPQKRTSKKKDGDK